MALPHIERLLKQSTGLDPESIGSSAVERAVRHRQRVLRMDDLEAYSNFVGDSAIELQALIDAVVVAETWFFRDDGAFARLGRLVRDEWLGSNATRVWRLLSLPCATGEEPFSMAITLLDAGLPPERFRVDAVDISARVVEQARQGSYTRGSFRTILADARQRHFVSAPGGWRLADTVRQTVQFRQGNIFGTLLAPGEQPYDVIFSRNLLIYFDRPEQDRAIGVLSGLLAPKGLLFAGPAETVAFINRRFAPDGTPHAFAFRKAVAAQPQTAVVTPFAPLRIVPRALRDPQVDAVVIGPAPSRLPSQPTVPAGRLDEATRLANQGRFEEALRCCQASVERDGPSADAFYLVGLIRDAEGNALEALSAYQKALYLNPAHETALVHLALLLEALGRKPEALRLRTRARRAAMGSGA